MNRDTKAILSTPQAKTWDLGPIKERVTDDPRMTRLLNQAEAELNNDQRQHIANILSYTEASKARMLDAANLASAAKRRKWAAEDRLREARRELAEAEVAAKEAEKDFLETREMMRNNWEVFFRPEVEAMPTTDDLPQGAGELGDTPDGARS